MKKRKNMWRPSEHGHKSVQTQGFFKEVLVTRDGIDKQMHDIEEKYKTTNPALGRFLCRELRRFKMRLVEK